MEKDKKKKEIKTIINIILYTIHYRNEINEIPDEELLQLISFVDNSSSGMTRTHKKQNGTCHTRVRFLNEQSEFRKCSSGVLLLLVREEKSGNVTPELIFLIRLKS